MIFDVTKVTYNMYSCDTCCMSREMMGTDGRDRAKCLNSGKNGHRCHFGNFLNKENDKIMHSVISYL